MKEKIKLLLEDVLPLVDLDSDYLFAELDSLGVKTICNEMQVFIPTRLRLFAGVKRLHIAASGNSLRVRPWS